MLISINWNVIKWTKSEFDFTDKSLSYWYWVFETMRTYDLQIFRLDEHLDRLFNSAKIIWLNNKFWRNEVIEFIYKISNEWNKNIKNEKNIIEARIKITITENYCIIYFFPNIFDTSIYNWVKAISFEWERFLPEAKTLNCLVSYIANEKAKKEWCFEAILVNKNWFISEWAYSNIFWVENWILYTTNKWILYWITRMTVLEKTNIINIKVVFDNNKTIQSLQKSDEVFITQSSKWIIPIIELNWNMIWNWQIWQLTQKLLNLIW